MPGLAGLAGARRWPRSACRCGSSLGPVFRLTGPLSHANDSDQRSAIPPTMPATPLTFTNLSPTPLTLAGDVDGVGDRLSPCRWRSWQLRGPPRLGRFRAPGGPSAPEVPSTSLDPGLSPRDPGAGKPPGPFPDRSRRQDRAPSSRSPTRLTETRSAWRSARSSNGAATRARCQSPGRIRPPGSRSTGVRGGQACICAHARTLALRRPSFTHRTLPAVMGLSQQSGPCRGLAGHPVPAA